MTGETQFHTIQQPQAEKWITDATIEKPQANALWRPMDGGAYNQLPGVRVPHLLTEGVTYTVYSLLLPDGEK